MRLLKQAFRGLGLISLLLVLATPSCGGGGEDAAEIPAAAREKALESLGGTVDEIYEEAVSTFGDEFAEGPRANEPVYGVLVTGAFESGGAQYSTALLVFDGNGKPLTTLWWVDERPPGPPFPGDHLPDGDAVSIDPAILTGE